MRLDTDDVKALQRPATDSDDRLDEAEAVKGIDTSVSANEVSEHACRLSPRALRHARKIGYCQHAHAVALPESLAGAVLSTSSRHLESRAESS